ncbi:hypothetical protein MLD38_025855 [Melastoma candidum]|uniref:Uncharacterized protein n=1 Tax=Melastoma candidum TaxID=119954 RepID=A0ACB9NXM8_9MYRT|nr:hypothetical protein MLD38_025855 [Melastoma candidum]
MKNSVDLSLRPHLRKPDMKPHKDVVGKAQEESALEDMMLYVMERLLDLPSAMHLTILFPEHHVKLLRPLDVDTRNQQQGMFVLDRYRCLDEDPKTSQSVVEDNNSLLIKKPYALVLNYKDVPLKMASRPLARKQVQLDDKGMLVIPKAVRAKGVSAWKNCVVGIVLAKRIPFQVLRKYATKLWGPKGLMGVIDLGMEKFLLRFEDGAQIEYILQRADWHIIGCPVLLQKWSTCLLLDKLELKSLPLRVRLKQCLA